MQWLGIVQREKILRRICLGKPKDGEIEMVDHDNKDLDSCEYPSLEHNRQEWATVEIQPCRPMQRV